MLKQGIDAIASPSFPFRFGTFSATRARGSRDLRPRVTRPAPAGRVTCARGSLGISEKETETQDCEITFQGSDSSVILFLEAGDSSCWWEEAEGRGLLGSLFHRSFERHNDVPLKCFFGEFFHEFLVTSPAHSLAE